QKFSDEQILIARDGQAQAVPAKSSKKVTTNILGFDFTHVVTGFWQSHISAAESLSNLLLSKVITAESTLDLYAGVGIFGRLLLENQKTQKLVSVELDAAASNSARENLQKFPRASVVSQRAEAYLKETTEEFDLVILDPPRKGLGIVATEHLATTAKEQIVYLSCDPASLARDTKELTKNGWHLSQLDLIDAFPQTHHLETLAVFSRIN
ncbi:MAG: methyltransferase, partial [Candidatus Nanopelagicales bacterium]